MGIRIHVDYDKCTGCGLCEIACSLKHEGSLWPEASRIRVFEFVPGITIPAVCQQCPDYPCVKACPTKALSVDEKTGAVIVNDDKGILCGLCVDACPGKIPRLNRVKATVMICDLCGGNPECVKICSLANHNALSIVKDEPPAMRKVYLQDPKKVTAELSAKKYTTFLRGGGK